MEEGEGRKEGGRGSMDGERGSKGRMGGRNREERREGGGIKGGSGTQHDIQDMIHTAQYNTTQDRTLSKHGKVGWTSHLKFQRERAPPDVMVLKTAGCEGDHCTSHTARGQGGVRRRME